jgi:hypothetical protein
MAAHLGHATTSDLSPLSGRNPDIEQTSPTDRVRPEPDLTAHLRKALLRGGRQEQR